MMKWWIRIPLYVKILIGALIGVALGFVLGENVKYIEPVGTIFLRLLQMLIIPLVVASILSGMLKMHDIRAMGSVGGRFLLYLFTTALFATSIGVGMGLIFQPGSNASGLLDHGEAVESEDFSFVDHFLTWIPTNIFESAVELNMLQLIVFTILIGLTIIMLGKERTVTATKLINEASDIMMKLTSMVISLAPYGVLALMATLVGQFDTSMLQAVAMFVLADYVGLILVLVIVYPLILKFVGGLSPLRFYANGYPTTLFGFTTSTSAATIPVSMQVTKKNMGISEKTTGFTIPFGATANMDGAAVAFGLIAVFAANVYGMDITFGMIVQFVLLGLVLSIGAAGVRGAGIVMSMVLFETLGMPLTLIPVLAATWPIIDMGHTATNVTGDLVGTAVVAKKTGDFDEKVFNAKNTQRITMK